MTQHRPGGEMRHVKPTRYSEDKAAGNAQIVKVGNQFIIDKKQFDPNTGQEGESHIIPVTAEQLEKHKKNLQAEITSIDEMIADIAALG